MSQSVRSRATWTYSGCLLLLFLLGIGTTKAFAPLATARQSKVVDSHSSQQQRPFAWEHVHRSSSAYADTCVAVDSSTTCQKNPLQTLSEEYSRWTKDHYLVMAFAQAAVLASVADITTQSFEGATMLSVDYGHVAAMATVASTMSGAWNAICLRQLEQAYPGKKTSHVFMKTMIHAIIIASIINSAYLVGVPLLSDFVYSTPHNLPHHMDWSILQGGWTWEEFVVLTKLEVAMFIPYNTLAFQFVPPNLRPLTHAAISATFNIAVSAVTLGYFHSWCDKAMSMMPMIQ